MKSGEFSLTIKGREDGRYELTIVGHEGHLYLLEPTLIPFSAVEEIAVVLGKKEVDLAIDAQRRSARSTLRQRIARNQALIADTADAEKLLADLS